MPFSWNTHGMINRPLPEPHASLAGYSALIEKYALNVPSPAVLSAISTKHTNYKTNHWKVFTPRYAPRDDFYAHLVFALRYEGLDLAVLNALFNQLSPSEIQPYILAEPSSKYARRLWFLYEYLQKTSLDIPDAKQGNFVEVLDDAIQYAGPKRPSKRHRVYNNLPGVAHFCPLIYRTKKLDAFIQQNLSQKVADTIDAIHSDVLKRAAAFLLLKDSKASYAIEGERPSPHRAERWAHIIGSAGQKKLSKEALIHLQGEVITDTRFVPIGYRSGGGFVGTHDRSTGMPLPDHISAKACDLETLLDGLIDTEQLLKDSDYPPVLTAALIAFGFVFIHPFEDGNGRLHRYLLHHILAETGFTPKGIVFPISSVMLDHITDYREVLEAYSIPRLPFVKWVPTHKGNVDVLNNTLDLYRFFDATKQAEFLYGCVHETITKTLPEEVDYLQKYDTIKAFIAEYIDMPEPTLELLIRFLYQNNGTLSKRAKKKEFSMLTDSEIDTLEKQFKTIFY